jgi:hypothetical protein
MNAVVKLHPRIAPKHAAPAPCDRATVEHGIRALYRSAGMSPPKQIVWCGGPVEIAKRLAAASAADAIGPSVRSAICAEMRRSSVESSDADSESAASDRHALADEIVRLVQEAADKVIFHVPLRARHAFEMWRGAPRRLPRETFLEVAIGPDEISALASREPLGAKGGVVARGASWIAPYANLCWVAEQPDTLEADVEGRLHCVDGPALRYRDGWSCFAWKGVEVPAWMIEHSELITPDAIDCEIDPALRDTMIDIMTPERFIASGDPSCVSRDETGALWRRRWTHRGVTIGIWAAVEIANAAPDRDGVSRRPVLCVPPRLRFARDAVAWAANRNNSAEKGDKSCQSP